MPLRCFSSPRRHSRTVWLVVQLFLLTELIVRSSMILLSTHSTRPNMQLIYIGLTWSCTVYWYATTFGNVCFQSWRSPPAKIPPLSGISLCLDYVARLATPCASGDGPT
ncbi:hypothetical protein PENSPDRAFT_121952 [Peniophora sp. CONT]|nr:hypothetical protein PENSPDRAFT_121952 [Peniophora sp. CONT]